MPVFNFDGGDSLFTNTASMMPINSSLDTYTLIAVHKSNSTNTMTLIEQNSSSVTTAKRAGMLFSNNYPYFSGESVDYNCTSLHIATR